MKSSIFIKTYAGDADWLKYCLRSIKRFCSGYYDMVVVSEDEAVIKPICDDNGIRFSKCKPPRPPYRNGYIWQQAVKLFPELHVKEGTEFVLFVDSDVVFFHDNTPQTWLVDGKPMLLITPYSYLKEKVPWKLITDKALNTNTVYETMRRFPIGFHIGSFSRTRDWISKVHGDWLSYLDAISNIDFSEFNAIGTVELATNSDNYHIIDTTKDYFVPPPIAKQYYSRILCYSYARKRYYWKSGITKEIAYEIESVFLR